MPGGEGVRSVGSSAKDIHQFFSGSSGGSASMVKATAFRIPYLPSKDAG